MKSILVLLSLILSVTSYAQSYNLFEIAANSIREEHHGRNYRRDYHFGHWKRVDNNCYDTRNYMLAKFSATQVEHYVSKPCKVKKGQWNTLYKANNHAFTSPKKLHVDHLVPLKEAFVSGAHGWSSWKRCHYNNFLYHRNHLILVSSTENLRKSDKEPGEYLPPNFNIRCEYLKQWMIVKSAWGLTYDSNEFEAIKYRFYEHNCDVNNFMVDANSLAQLQAMTNQPTQSCM